MLKRTVLLFISGVLLVFIASAVPAQDLTIHCINVGQGDCTLIESPSGRTMMVDAGRNYNTPEAHLCSYLGSLGIDTLNYFIATHYHIDHIGGIDTMLLKGIVIDTVIDRGWWGCTQFYTTTYEPAVQDIRQMAVDGRVIDLGGGVTVEIVAVNGNGLLSGTLVDDGCSGGSYDENTYSIAMVVDYNDFQFYVGGDLPGSNEGSYRDIETSVAPEVGDVEVYQVNHHGSEYSTNEVFLETLNPEVSIISVGNNSYGHPDTAVVRRLGEVSSVYQTQDDNGNTVDGDVVIQTDGFDSFSVNGQVYSIPVPVYYHAFQNYDDDVDRVKTYTNFFGGDHGITPDETQITSSYDTLSTRTGCGRCLQIDYGPLSSWGMYVESFDRRWWDEDNYTSFDLTDLFPDYADPDFQGRGIDSIVFYCKLVSGDALTLKLELHDTLKNISDYTVVIDVSDEWQRVSAALDQFSGDFDPSIAKYIGFTFADYPDNVGESGILYVDDIYLVENGFDKPVFSNDNDLLAYLNEVNFRYFWTAVEPISKFALDRHIYSDLISVDAIGFQLTSYAIAHRRGWIDPTAIENRVEHILDYLLHQCNHAADSQDVKDNPLAYATVEGNWAHFMSNTTLARKDTDVEFSLFSSALLLSGVLVCHEYFDWNANIVKWADSLYRMTDWNFLYYPDDSLMYLAWCPEEGYSEYLTDWFTEESDLAFLLAISNPEIEHRIPANPFESSHYLRPLCGNLPGDNFVFSAPGANFTYYFLQMYARYPLAKGESVWRINNVTRALLADVACCQADPCALGYDSRIFGITACEGPDSCGEDGMGGTISNYHAYGYDCRHDTINASNGTIAVYGSGAAMPFIPYEATACLKYYYNELDSTFKEDYGYHFWSPIFGFPDAFHLAPGDCGDTLVSCLNFRGPWISVPRFGIDVGPMLINIDSYLSESNAETSIRDIFSNHPYIIDNLPLMEPIISEMAEDNIAVLPELRLYPNYPNPFNTSTVIEYTIPRRALVTISIYNILGQMISVVTDEIKPAGRHLAVWRGENDHGDPVTSGIYFYRIEVDGFKKSKKALLLK